MTPRINDEIRQALNLNPGKPLEVEDDQAHTKDVIVPAEAFQKVQALFFDDGEFNPREAYPIMDQTFGGPEGWKRPEWKPMTTMSRTGNGHDDRSQPRSSRHKCAPRPLIPSHGRLSIAFSGRCLA